MWVKTKLGITNEKRSLSIAYAVAEKIKALGTEIFLNPNKGIELDEKIKELRARLNKEIGLGAKLEITQRLDRFKKIYKQKI